MTKIMKVTTGSVAKQSPVVESSQRNIDVTISYSSVPYKIGKIIKTTENGVIKFNNFTGVTSDVVAQFLGIPHKNLIRSIKKAISYNKLMSSNLSSLNIDFHPIFQDYTYLDSRSREQKCVLMNEDGVKALIKVVDTQEAYNCFAIIMSDFKEIKLERIYREESKQNFLEYTAVLQELYKRLKKAGSSQIEKFLYTNCNKQIYKAITGKKYTEDCLDTLSAKEAVWLSEIRIACTCYLKDLLKIQKEPQEIRKKLWEFIDNFSFDKKVA